MKRVKSVLVLVPLTVQDRTFSGPRVEKSIHCRFWIIVFEAHWNGRENSSIILFEAHRQKVSQVLPRPTHSRKINAHRWEKSILVCPESFKPFEAHRWVKSIQK